MTVDLVVDSQRFQPLHGASALSPAARPEARDRAEAVPDDGARTRAARAMAISAEAGSEAEVVARAQAGEHGAFEALVGRYQGALYTYVYRLMGSAEDAADLTQDELLKAYLALPRTSADLRVGAWLYRIATNVCLDELRHRKLVRWQPWAAFVAAFHPAQVAPEGSGSPERACLAREDAAEVQALLGELPPKYRLCLLLREYQGLSYDEIADVLSTTRAAVKSLLFRAREEFRQRYARAPRQPGRAMEYPD